MTTGAEPFGEDANGGVGIDRLVARDVMTSDVVTLTPSQPLRDAARVLLDRGVSGAPVVDSEGRLVGILSERDLIDGEKRRTHLPHVSLFGVFILSEETLRRAFSDGGFIEVREIMTPKPIYVDPETRLTEITGLLTARKVNRIPVVDGGRVVGIITRGDILRALSREWEQAEQ